MPVRLHHVVIDTHDLPGLARFWTQALGWKVLSERENEIVIGTDENGPVGICFTPVTDPKTVKNRVHLDLTSSAADRDQEIDGLLALGARRADIGQTGAESWTVLADPEGNEFCVVRPKETAHPLRLDALRDPADPDRGMSAHLRARLRCISMQPEQSVTDAIGACATLPPTGRMPLCPRA